MTAHGSALARSSSSSFAETVVAAPDHVRVQRHPHDAFVPASRSDASVVLTPEGAGLRVEVDAEEVSRLVLRWRSPQTSAVLVLGDAWERSYGDLGWRGLQPERPLPWTVLVHDPAIRVTTGHGVEVRGAAFATWTVDEEGLSLWLDLRNGGRAVRLDGRRVTATVIRALGGTGSPFEAQRALYQLLCSDPLPSGALVGTNNWYYAYGLGFGAAAVVRDARMVAELAGDHPVRPYAVVDDGWSVDGTADGRRASGGPWDVGRPPTFPDMVGVAEAIRAEGARPGIWYRPLLLRADREEVPTRRTEDGFVLDPSHPAGLERVAADVSRLRGWGFDLIKHDFSTFDLLGRWGPEMGADPTDGRWLPADPHRTTAEILVDLYRTVHDSAGGAVVLGCNLVGHLAAGLVEAQRTGDDTSGRVWSRTRRTAVNTLAFRLAQHKTLFTLDADCVPSTAMTPWSLNRRLLDLLARSGTALFVSVDPTTRSAQVDADLSSAIRLGLDGGEPEGVEPLDWLSTTSPSLWRTGRDETRYAWLEPFGAELFED